MLQPFLKSPSYQAELSALLRMHQLSVAGKEESEEADLIRESASDYWDELSKTEKDRLTGLSKDLYEISDGPPPQEPMSGQAQIKLMEAYEARDRGDWDKALAFLRESSRHIPPPLLSYLRGRIWESAGNASAAAIFLEHACHLEPGNEGFQVSFLRVLGDADPSAARKRADEILRSSEQQLPSVVVSAAAAVFDSIRNLANDDYMQTCKQLIPILEHVLIKLNERGDLDRQAVGGMAVCLLAELYRETGDKPKAYFYYSRAIQLDPSNDALLTSRGMLMYGASPGAIDDFEKAIQLGTQLVWPYFYLAHYYLTKDVFQKCREMCERGLLCPANSQLMSVLHELLAISSAQLGYPELFVRTEFENAIRVDPTNERALRNKKRFEDSFVAHSSNGHWEQMTVSSMNQHSHHELRQMLIPHLQQ